VGGGGGVCVAWDSERGQGATIFKAERAAKERQGASIVKGKTDQRRKEKVAGEKDIVQTSKQTPGRAGLP